MGLVSKSQSTWTLICPTGITFSRPSTKAYVRFKLTSIQQDFVTYDVSIGSFNKSQKMLFLKRVNNFSFNWILLYFLPIASCLRDSMGIRNAFFFGNLNQVR